MIAGQVWSPEWRGCAGNDGENRIVPRRAPVLNIPLIPSFGWAYTAGWCLRSIGIRPKKWEKASTHGQSIKISQA